METIAKPEAHIGALVDRMYRLTLDKRALAAKVDEVDKKIRAIEEELLERIPMSDSTGVMGKSAKAVVKVSETATISEWDDLCKWVARNKRFDLFQRRVNSRAVKDLWDDGKTVPGVEKFTAKKISLTKL